MKEEDLKFIFVALIHHEAIKGKEIFIKLYRLLNKNT